MRKKPLLLLSILLLVLLYSCATIPRASVDMSMRLEQQLYALKQANEQMINSVYAAKEESMVAYIDNVWFPEYLDGLFKNPGIIKIWDEIVASDDMSERMEALIWFNGNVQSQYRAVKDSLLAPVREEKESVLEAFDKEYNTAIRINSTIMRNIASVNAVQEAYKGYADRFVDTDKLDSILQASLHMIDSRMDQVQHGVNTNKNNESKINELLKKLK